MAGDMNEIIDHVMLASDDDRVRFRELIRAALEAEEIPACGEDVFRKENHAPAKAAKAKEAKAAVALKKRQVKADKEAKEAEELWKDIQLKHQKRDASGDGGGGSETSLGDLIRARQAERAGGFDAWAAKLEAKYASADCRASGNRKSKKQGK